MSHRNIELGPWSAWGPFKTKDSLMEHSALSFMVTEVILTLTDPETRALKACGLNTDWYLFTDFRA